jgi:2-isopropylmalate synthase
MKQSKSEHPRRLQVAMYDTTLRDGSQREGISYSCDDKLRVAQRLDAIGIAYIEGGWPGSNPKDAEFFEKIRDVPLTHAKVTAFGSTRRAAVLPEEDVNLRALLAANTEVCTLFGKTSPLHVREVLRIGLDENLAMIEDSIAFLRNHKRRVFYDAEHFFDGYREDASYAFETLLAAVRGGAEIVVVCDTNGGTMPWEVFDILSSVFSRLDHPFGIHAHNDGECAVANSLAAVRAGASHVQGTINGYGERCGNANLCSVIPNVELKLGKQALPDGNLPKLFELSRFVSEVANLPNDEHAPYIGRSAFAHKGGVHVAAMRRNAASYQHIEPELVGNVSRVVISELSGRGNVRSKAEEFGLQVAHGADVAILEQIKDAESQGFSFEAAEASVALLVHRASASYQPPFRLIDYKVMVANHESHLEYSEATIKLAVGDKIFHTAAEGNGPVSALDAALRKALVPIFPALKEMHLVDYKVRILNGNSGTSATTRVLLTSKNPSGQWSTVGASANIIEASWSALADSIEFAMLMSKHPEALVQPKPKETQSSPVMESQ